MPIIRISDAMTISDYQISSVIKTYVRNMKSRIRSEGPVPGNTLAEDTVTISEEGMKRMLFERIEEKMTERLRRYDQQE
jgi:hypothetical protein